MQLMVFMINIVIVSCLLSWRLALSFIILGTILTLFFYSMYYPYTQIQYETSQFGFKIVYLLFLISSTLIIFLKPKQEYLEATEAKVDTLETEVTHLDHEIIDLSGKVTNLNDKVMHYSKRVSDQEKEIERLGATAQRILNNVNHELRLPVGNVKNFSEMLHGGLEKYTPEQLKELSDEVYKNSTRLSSMILNMLDLANLNVKKVHLEKSTVNFSETVKNRVQICRNVYLQAKPLDFKLTINPEIMISVDPNYIRQLIDNLVINAINFSEKGIIEIKVDNQKNYAVFTITDQGIGIPKENIYDIFDPFKMGF